MVKVQTAPLIPRPYPNRSDRLPWHKEEVTAEWLTSVLQNRYPGVVVENMELLVFIDSHTSKLRMALDFNQAGQDAGLPRQVCLKSNFSGLFADVDICQLEAMFYYFLGDKLSISTPRCYYADWDDDGKGHGVIILEDLEELGGKFGNSLDDVGIDAVSSALEGLAHLHSDLWNSPVLEQSDWLPTFDGNPNRQ